MRDRGSETERERERGREKMMRVGECERYRAATGFVCVRVCVCVYVW